MIKQCIILLLLSVVFCCEKQKKVTTTNPLEIVLASKDQKIQRVMNNLQAHEVQIIFTQIERTKDSLLFTDYDFQLDSTQYFYPASTVKFPIALLALAKLNTLKNIDRNTRFYVEGDTLETTFAKEIEKIFTVSDNEAYNRLFEFLGQDYINSELSQLAIGTSRISHRLSTSNADEITSKPLIIYENDSTTTTLSPTINTSARPLNFNALQKGTGYYEEDSLMQAAFDFSLKNYYPIATQHQFLKRVMFPEKYATNQKPKLSESQLAFVHKTMQLLPKEAGYDRNTYYDGYCKFFMYGDTKEAIPEHINIYNKVGDAYGTLTDCAYIQDTKNDVEFLLTATILVNKNGVFNDDTYEYDEIGFPFLAALGRALYQQELDRKTNTP